MGSLGLAQLDGLVFQRGVEAQERLGLFFNSGLEDGYRSAAYKVLRRLELEGLVRANHFTNLPKCYTLRPDGHRCLKQLWLNTLQNYREIGAETLVKHELAVAGVGLVLSELWGLKVSAEHERFMLSSKTSRRKYQLPDLWISDPKTPKALEIERTQKSEERYKQLWGDYGGGLPVEAVVLYLTDWPNGSRILLKLARKFLLNYIFFAELDDFKASLGRCPFVNYRGDELWLSENPSVLAAPPKASLDDREETIPLRS